MESAFWRNMTSCDSTMSVIKVVFLFPMLPQDIDTMGSSFINPKFLASKCRRRLSAIFLRQRLKSSQQTVTMLHHVIQSSLIVANYSIRTDNALLDNGNFPLWLTDFFPKRRRECSRHAHILDFDVLRLGKKVLENNPKAGSFEFGVVAITEIGKERGNNLELKEVKRNTDDTNQKNYRLLEGVF